MKTHNIRDGGPYSGLCGPLLKARASPTAATFAMAMTGPLSTAEKMDDKILNRATPSLLGLIGQLLARWHPLLVAAAAECLTRS